MAGVRCDLLEVKRVAGKALLLRWRIANTSETDMYQYPRGWEYGYPATELYYVDEAESKKYLLLESTEAGRKFWDVFDGDLKPGQTVMNWAKFPAPTSTTTKITIYIPKFMPFEGIPIAQ
jgi:hypothetical protein